VSVTGGLQAALPATPGFGVTMQDDGAVVVGEAPSLLAHQAAVAAATDAVGAAKVLDLSTVAPGGMVQVEVKVVEMSRNVLKDVGISIGASNTRGGFQFGLANAGPAAAGAWNLTTNLMRGAFNLDVAVSLLQSNGLARVLAEPTLLALSGQSASFLAGGEIPIPTAGGLGTQNVEYKPFGIGLTLTPTVLASDRIALKVAPEASELDWGNAIPVATGDSSTLIPALRTRRADTTVELGDGESFVIGGLVSRTTLASVNKLPFLGDLPIIGALFRNMRYSQEEKELVIIVTPHLVRPIARGATLPLPGQREERRDYAGNAWGYHVLGIASGQQMPGFSR
jgi:pilus assembly protein CpaC